MIDEKEREILYAVGTMINHAISAPKKGISEIKKPNVGNLTKEGVVLSAVEASGAGLRDSSLRSERQSFLKSPKSDKRVNASERS
jgi:hypothetical protein